VVTRYQVDPGVSQILPRIYLADRFGGSLTFCYFPDPPLTAPFEEQAYYSPAPYADFGLGYVMKDVYRNPTSPCNFREEYHLYQSPHMAASDPTQLNLFLLGRGTLRPVFSTTSETLPLGIGPYRWIGLFRNAPNKIMIWSGLGPWPSVGANPWMFVGQLGDVRNHFPLPYELYTNGGLIQKGSINDAVFVEIPIPTPGTYTLKIPFSNYFIAGQQGSALMEASFDTSKSDPNPPYPPQFNIMENGEVTDTLLTGRGQVVFKLWDDVGINQVALYYDAGGGWQGLTVNKTGDEYLANLPSLGANTFVSLKLVAEDTSGNRLSYEMRPALLFGRIETVSPPSTPSGPASGIAGTSYNYSTTGALSSSGHPVEYQFDWKGDGTDLSPWGSATQSKTWAVPGTYNVKARARCVTDHTVVSSWSQSLTVAINPSHYNVSGYVRTAGGTGISGVLLYGLPNNPLTYSNGYYSGTVPYGWSATVKPGKSGYTFNPPSRSYSNVTSSQTDQNYTGNQIQTYTISGYVKGFRNVGISGVVMVIEGLPDSPITDPNGYYSATVSSGWSGTVTPTLSGYVFNPASRSYSNVTSNQSGQGYSGFRPPIIKK
jgi:hypothetical protein